MHKNDRDSFFYAPNFLLPRCEECRSRVFTFYLLAAVFSGLGARRNNGVFDVMDVVARAHDPEAQTLEHGSLQEVDVPAADPPALAKPRLSPVVVVCPLGGDHERAQHNLVRRKGGERRAVALERQSMQEHGADTHGGRAAAHVLGQAGDVLIDGQEGRVREKELVEVDGSRRAGTQLCDVESAKGVLVAGLVTLATLKQ